jgi:eukaryotic-like serine/threonine-protein kinase
LFSSGDDGDVTALTSVRVVEGEARLFGEFDLIAKLGRGGMAEAFLAAKRAKPAELMVVKRLTPDFADDLDHRAMLEEEARIMPLFSHPNVVRTVEAGQQEGQAYLAMEFLDGLPLDQCFDAVLSLGPEAALHVACELLDGLHYVHELRGSDGAALEIVHRDVSPHNVFVTYEGRVTVVDFGIAKSRGRRKHTSTGVVRGKLAYMAPEQALCDEVDRRSDVFAVGVILWELLHGRRYWEALGDVQILKRMTFGDLPGIDDSIEEPVRGILAKALAAKPEERFATARELRAELVKVKSTNLSRKDLGRAVEEAAAGYRDAVRAVVDAHLSVARGTDGLPGVDPAVSSKDRAPVSAPKPQAPSAIEAAVASNRGEPASGRATANQPITMPPPAAGAVTAAAPSPVVEAAPVLPFRTLTETGGASALDLPQRPRASAGLFGRGAVWAIAATFVAAGIMAAVLYVRAGNAGDANLADAAGDRSTVGGAPTSAPKGPAPEGALIAFELHVKPEGARVFLDEMQVSELPFSAKLERSGKARALRIEAEGYVPQSRILVLDRDQTVEISLEPEPRELAPQTSTRPAGSGGKGRPNAAPTVTTAPQKGPTVADPTNPWGKKKTP